MRLEAIADPADPRLRDYRDLRRPRAAGIFVVEGRPLVEVLLAAPRVRPRSVVTTPAALAALRPALDGVADLLVYVVSRPAIDALVGYPFHRGCLAVAERGAPVRLEALLAADGPVVALERVADPENVGGVVRNAAAFGAAGVLLGPGCADPFARKALRVSTGAALVLPIVQVDDWSAALARLAAARCTLVALAPHASRSIADLATAPPRRLALLLGTEWAGLGPAAQAAATVTVRIPMAPGVDSLNVATAAAIALHRLAPEHGWQSRGGDGTTEGP